MSDDLERPLALALTDAPPRKRTSGYPEVFRPLVAGRDRRTLGDLFGLTNFGVNVTRIAPGSMSALMHRHARQDEFVLVLEGEATLVTDRGETRLTAGMCAGFPAGGLAHHLVNRGSVDVLVLEVGDRTPGDRVDYPQDDLIASDSPGGWIFTRRDGTVY